ncbi:hypothetical protein, partial [Chitinivorax sp. B]|uniref:hypothetical protein n=1 Tax=Chitinivorax sp. B TaxID=2502235 RepID=UPI001BB27FFA
MISQVLDTQEKYRDRNKHGDNGFRCQHRHHLANADGAYPRHDTVTAQRSLKLSLPYSINGLRKYS